ncbi:MAG: hypothetical protein WBN23_13370, partial [Woeseia sp.]
MLSLPQTFKLDSALANGEASAGKAFSLGAGSTAEGGGFSDTLRATQPQQGTATATADAAGGRLPADGKSLPPSRDLPASGPIKSLAAEPDKLPAAAALPVTGPIKQAVTLPPGVALVDHSVSAEGRGLELAPLTQRMTRIPGRTEFMDVAADSAAAPEPAAVEVPATLLPAPALPELPSTALHNLVADGLPPRGLPLNALHHRFNNALPNALTGAAGQAAALPVTTPYQRLDVSLPGNSAVARDAAPAVQLTPLAAGTSAPLLRSAGLVPDLMQAAPGQSPLSVQRHEAPPALAQARLLQATPSGPPAPPLPNALSPTGPGAAVFTGATLPLPQELPLPAPLPTAAVAPLQPDRTAQTILRGAQAGSALAVTPQLADAARAVSDAVQLAQPVPQQDITVHAAGAQTRGDAALLAAPFAPARQDLFTTPGMTTVRTTATRA